MPDATAPHTPTRRRRFARFALLVSLLLPVYFAIAALGTRAGLWGWQTGLGTLIIGWGPRLIMLVGAVALLALGGALWRRPRAGWLAALVALLIPAAALGYLASVRASASAIPPIHDISTDRADPPAPSAGLLAVREAAGANPVMAMDVPLRSNPMYREERFADIAGQSLGAITGQAYPRAVPIRSPLAPAATFAAVRAAVQEQGLAVTTAAPAQGRIEAVATSFWFGFKDDVIIRVRAADGGGSTVDVRSISRVGVSDLGANARRIETLSAAILSRLASQ